MFVSSESSTSQTRQALGTRLIRMSSCNTERRCIRLQLKTTLGVMLFLMRCSRFSKILLRRSCGLQSMTRTHSAMTCSARTPLTSTGNACVIRKRNSAGCQRASLMTCLMRRARCGGKWSWHLQSLYLRRHNDLRPRWCTCRLPRCQCPPVY